MSDEKQPQTNQPTSLTVAKERVQRLLFLEMEKDSARLAILKIKLEQIESMVMDKVIEELDSNKINAYNSASILHKLVDSVYKIERAKMDLFDRLQGTDEGPAMADGKSTAGRTKEEHREYSRFSEMVLSHIVAKRNELENS